MDIHAGDVVKLKKQHPCGSAEWQVLRSGADFRLQCQGCGRQVMIARRILEKSVKEVIVPQKALQFTGKPANCNEFSPFQPPSAGG